MAFTPGRHSSNFSVSTRRQLRVACAAACRCCLCAARCCRSDAHDVAALQLLQAQGGAARAQGQRDRAGRRRVQERRGRRPDGTSAEAAAERAKSEQGAGVSFAARTARGPLSAKSLFGAAVARGARVEARHAVLEAGTLALYSVPRRLQAPAAGLKSFAEPRRPRDRRAVGRVVPRPPKLRPPRGSGRNRPRELHALAGRGQRTRTARARTAGGVHAVVREQGRGGGVGRRRERAA